MKVIKNSRKLRGEGKRKITIKFLKKKKTSSLFHLNLVPDKSPVGLLFDFGIDSLNGQRAVQKR